MATQVRSCPKCFKLMWLKEEQWEPVDENTVRTTCPHCQQTIRLKLVTQGNTAAGPKMGH